MWLSFFSIAVAASIFLGVAAVMVQDANHGDTLQY